MHAIAKCLALLCILAGPGRALPADDDTPAAPKPPARLTAEQRRDLRAMSLELRKAEDADTRADLFDRMLAVSPAVAPELLTHVNRQLRTGRQEYVRQLGPAIAKAYVKRLLALTDEQIYQALMTRRLWQDYAVNTSGRHDFRNVFLKPADTMGQILLPSLDDIQDAAVAARRKRLLEFAGYQEKCHKILGVDADPTKTKVSPTGIPYPPLDNPPTFLTVLDYLERTIVLMYTVASPGARDVLMANVEAAAEIDVQEAEFAMYGNRVRMLVGSVAWRVDPLMSACARDHSNDRKEGRASGHSSTVPGKEGFTKRLKRFGSWGRSEGAGGGKSGYAYIRGLSYGGGHTGPLYSTKRNVVGIGGRRGCFTSIYRTEKNLLHPCPALDGDIFMPPGLRRGDIRSSQLQSIYLALHRQRYAAARALIDNARADGEREQMILRFFSAAIRVEMDWCFEGIEHIDKAGDVYEVRVRLNDAIARFGKIPAFRERSAPLEERLRAAEAIREIRNGELFRKMLKTSFTAATLKQFIAHCGESVYSKAAQWNLDKKLGEGQKGFHPLTFFFADDKALKQYGYPGPWR